MSKAFVDTTILADSLLKIGVVSKTANDALRRFETTELPVYAIKEFKAGPLKNFCWFHNKLALLGSFEQAVEALHRMSLTPKRYTTATAIEALKGAAGRMRNANLDSLVQKYGQAASLDKVLCDQFRLSLKTKILKAWRRRKQITTHVVCPLSCYSEVDPYEHNRVIMVNPTTCNVESECCLAPELRKRVDDLEKIRKVLLKEPKTRENERRARALRQLIRKPKAAVSEQTCRDLGDAFFALFAPTDSVILTTNTKDHAPLAAALGKRTEAP
jgi:hypothetical protein